MEVVGISNHDLEGGGSSSLGHEYLLTTSDHLVATGHAFGFPSSQSGFSSFSTVHGPASTLVGSTNGLEINLIWDNSVRTSANWSAIEAAVTAAAKIYTQNFSTHIVVNIAVGFGEIAGTRMGSGALGESESNGYIAGYSLVQSSLSAADQGLVTAGLMTSGAVSSGNPPTNANFFITSAEAKALGLVNGSSSGIDGYIGLTNLSSLLYFSTNGGSIGKSQYDAVGVAAHEISEVLGRIGLEGQTLGSFNDVYTPLDLFRYSASGVRDLTPTAGYFSTTLGTGGPTNLNSFNNPLNGGDSSDWASTVLNDAYDAFGSPGVVMHVSSTDLLEVASLGFSLNSTAVASINGGGSIVA